MAERANLVSVPTLVESPFIVVTIGGVTFGSYSGGGAYAGGTVQYPNFLESMEVVKVNGTVNTYTINFSYQVRPGDDPNLLEEIFAMAAKERKVKLQYGDYASPSYIYKEEVCIITNLTSSLSMSSSLIKYTLNCTSDAIGLTSTPYDFPARKAKPSDVLKEMLNNPKYGMKKIFSGMQNNQKVLSGNLIASNDKTVNLVSQYNMNALDYMNYLVSSMVDSGNKQMNNLGNSMYYLTIHDDTSNTFGGTYFKVTEVSDKTRNIATTNAYEIDVNYPEDHMVTEFNVNNNQVWSILYETATTLKQEDYSYQIDREGNLQIDKAPGIIKSPITNKVSPTLNNWWTKMTSFPISASITIKGLTRPSILMSYVKVNVWFNGAQKHISSGLYIVTQQTDYINANGYRTRLELLRIGGD